VPIGSGVTRFPGRGAADLIDGVRVAFYGFDCPKDVVVPKNGSGQLPVGCAGFVTATPKTKDNKDVDPRVHGSEIQWIHWEGHEQVKVEDFPGVPLPSAAAASSSSLRRPENTTA
jgi:hypothetical protein